MPDMPMGRMTDICSGHECYAPTIAIEGSSNTMCNDLPIHRQTDSFMPHCCYGCHVPHTAIASPSVYVNDLQASHIGSRTDCSPNNILMTGSFDTWIEGG